MLGHYILTFGLTTVILLCVALFVLVRGYTSESARYFTILTLCVALWSGSICAALLMREPSNAILCWRLSHVGGISIPTVFLLFIVASLQLEQAWLHRFAHAMVWVQGIFLVCNFTPWIVQDVRPKLHFELYMHPGPLYAAMMTWWVLLAAVGLWQLHQATLKAVGSHKVQLQYISWGAIFAGVGGLPNVLLVYGAELVPLTPYGTLGVPVYALISTYALMQYRLLGLSVAVVRGALLIGVYSVVVGVPLAIALGAEQSWQRLLGDLWWFIPLLVGIVLAIIGPFAYLSLQHTAEGALLRNQRQYQFTLLQASLGMTRVRDSSRLLKLIVGVVTRIAGIRAAALFLKDDTRHKYVLASSRHYKWVLLDGQIPNEEHIIKWLLRTGEPLVVGELQLRGLGQQQPRHTAEQLSAQLERLGIAVVVPSYVEHQLIGFLALGPKRTGEPYSTADLQMFTALAMQCGLAVENAASFERLQQTQAQLFQAQKLGTLGQMASGMSHQIHNRLNVLSLAAQNARINVLPRLEKMIHGLADAPEDMRHTVGELKHFYRVIEEESERGAHIVRGLLSYSKPSREEEVLPVRELISKALEMLKYKQQLDSINIVRDVPKGLPMVKGHRSQLQDVFFNLIDNACDALREKQELMVAHQETTDYRGEIRIRASQVESPQDMLQITLSDNGVGMTDEELKQIFIPFFTTKATALKGTGMGLFIIHKIVEAHHGTIRAFSNPGKGTVFIVELPIVLPEATT